MICQLFLSKKTVDNYTCMINEILLLYYTTLVLKFLAFLLTGVAANTATYYISIKVDNLK